MVLRTEERHGIRHRTTIYRVTVSVRKKVWYAFENFGRCRQCPVIAFIEWWNEGLFILQIDQGAGLLGRCFQDHSGGRVWMKRLGFLDADRLQHVDHGLIANQPGLGLYKAVEGLEKAHIIGNRRVEDAAKSRDGTSLVAAFFHALRQRIELHALAVRDGFGDISLTAAFQV